MSSGVLQAVSLSPGPEPGLLKHLRQLPELRGAPALPGHLPAAWLPGHRGGHGGAAEGGQEPGMFPRGCSLPSEGPAPVPVCGGFPASEPFPDASGVSVV